MPVPTVDPPALADPAVLADPYPSYRALRQQAAVGWCAPIGLWVVSGWSAADQLLRHPATRSDQFRRRRAQVAAVGDFDDLLRIVGLQMVFMNPPDHPRVRRALQAAFTPRAVADLRPSVEARVADLSAGLEPGVDVIAAFAEPLPALVVADLLGVPSADRQRFVAWSHVLVDFVGTGRNDQPYLDDAQLAMGEWAAYFAELAESQRGSGSVLGVLLAQLDRGELTWDELVANAIFLLAAGHETTTNLIGNGLLALARDPGAWTHMRGDAALVETAVEELLRYDAPVQLMGRTTSAAVELEGVELPSDADVLIAVGVPTAIRWSSPIRNGWSSTVTPTATWASPKAPTSASARHSPGSRVGARSPRSPPAGRSCASRNQWSGGRTPPFAACASSCCADLARRLRRGSGPRCRAVTARACRCGWR